MPLLWHCAREGLVSEKIASHSKLQNQLGKLWNNNIQKEEVVQRGTLPMEELFKKPCFHGCIEILKAIHGCDETNDHVKALNLGRLLLMCDENIQQKSRVEKLLDVTSKYYLNLQEDKEASLMEEESWTGVANWQEVVRDENDQKRGTLLQLAVKFNVERAIKFLLQQKGVVATATSEVDKKPPAAIAANHGYHKVLKLLLKRGMKSNCSELFKLEEETGRNLLHLLFDHDNVHYYKGMNQDDISYARCVEVLIEKNDNPDEKDLLELKRVFLKEINYRDHKDGNTPLHLAARLQDREAILTLLRHGASVNMKNKEGVRAFRDIPLDTLQEFLVTQVFTDDDKEKIHIDLRLFKPWNLPDDNPDSSAYPDVERANGVDPREKLGVTQQAKIMEDQLNSARQTRRDIQLTMENSIGDGNIMAESEKLLYIFENNPHQVELIANPVLKMFLEKKWRKPWCFYYTYIQIFLWYIFSVYLTVYVYMAFGGKKLYMNYFHNSSNVDEFKNASYYQFNDAPKKFISIIGFPLVALTVMLLSFELLQFIIAATAKIPCKYFMKSSENVLQLSLFCSTMVILFCQGTDPKDEFNSHGWLRHLAALCIVLSWTLTLFVYGKWLPWATYVSMFRAVAWSYVKLAFLYLILVGAYGFAFYIMLHK